MKSHKDLPSGSQEWARQVDAFEARIAHLEEMVKRLSSNANIDYGKPERGVNAGSVPSVQNPVRQKLSSLADVGTYNVAEGQVLTWSQQDQKWIPATPEVSGGGEDGSIDVSALSYSYQERGYGEILDSEHYAYTAANVRPGSDFGAVEVWATHNVYIGTGNWELGPGVALIEMDIDGFGRPYVQLSADDYVDGSYGRIVIASYVFRIDTPLLVMPHCTTATRPDWLHAHEDDKGSCVYDTTIKKPIWWDTTTETWRDALGTAV